MAAKPKARKTQTMSRRTKTQKRPAAFALIKVRYNKRRRQLVITFSLPRRGRPKHKAKRLTKKQLWLNRAKSYGLTAALLVIFMLGAITLTRSLVESQSLPARSLAPPVIKSLATQQPLGLTRSVPMHIAIPAIQLNSDIVTIGQKADGSLQVPGRPDVTGWYNLGPSPGEVGPAIIVGHVDSLTGPAVFWNLRNLKAGDQITVTRQDGAVVSFTVDSLASFDQANFPTQAVYGNINGVGLRLITCGGTFNYLTRHYSHNTVVFASLH